MALQWERHMSDAPWVGFFTMYDENGHPVPVDHDLKGKPIRHQLAADIADRPVPIPGINDGPDN